MRNDTSFQPRSFAPRPVLAACCVIRCTALDKAAAKAKLIVTITLSILVAPGVRLATPGKRDCASASRDDFQERRGATFLLRRG